MFSVAELTAALVRVPTTEPQTTVPAIALCGEALAAAGFRLRRQVETAPGIAHALFERDGDGPPLLIDGHLDTVPPGDLAAWRRDALGGEIADGAVWGRGAADDKGPIAAALAALQGFSSRRRLLFSLGNDEELHMRGIQALMEDPAVCEATQAIALEPTSLTPVLAHKGNARIRVDVQGRPAHASCPWMGRNAIDEKMRLIDAVRAQFAAGEGARRVAAFGDEPATLVVTREHTPNTAFNVIPDRASCWYNFRWLPGGEPLEALLAQIAAQAQALGVEAEAAVEYWSPALLTPAEAPLTRMLAEISGHAPKWEPYGTHGGHLCKVIPEVVVFGPGELNVAHRENEHITLQALEEGVATLRAALEALAG